jgi:hypothetical protein
MIETMFEGVVEVGYACGQVVVDLEFSVFYFWREIGG